MKYTNIQLAAAYARIHAERQIFEAVREDAQTRTVTFSRAMTRESAADYRLALELAEECLLQKLRALGGQG